MTYEVRWSRDQNRTVSTVAELDAVLDEVTATGHLYAVRIAPPSVSDERSSPWDDGSLPQEFLLGVGHPERSFFWLGDPGGFGYEPDVAPWPKDQPDIEFLQDNDVLYCGGDRSRVGPETARRAAHEYIQTGQRPDTVQWPTRAQH